MLRFACLIIALFIAAVWADTKSMGMLPMPDGRIVGGKDADIRQFPHQISMRYNGRHRCGGSIYSHRIIVSAAHCVIDVDASMLSIVVGTTLLSEATYGIPVTKYIIHDKYRSITSDYDVAILVLRDALEFSKYAQPIELASERPEAGAEVTVTGWGVLVEDGVIPDHLQQVDVNVIDNSKCKSSYSILLTSRMLCAGVTGGGKDACQGDSGGPLIHNNKLLGIVSWGTGCARKYFPGVYASVPDLHDWVVRTSKLNTIEFAEIL